jgi:uncharacterized protein (DUF1697 family)
VEDWAAGMSESRTLIALLRGVNVGGRNSVPMADLRSVLETTGLEDVRTYIQSGNVVFRSRVPGKTLAAQMEDAIADAFGVRPAVLLRTPVQLDAVVDSNPFLAAGADTTKLHVVFLERRPAAKDAGRLDPDRSPPDAFALVGLELYLHLPNGAGRSRLGIDYVERTLGVRATQRNWNTVLRLLALARE